jgi:hypothetical protein
VRGGSQGSEKRNVESDDAMQSSSVDFRFGFFSPGSWDSAMMLAQLGGAHVILNCCVHKKVHCKLIDNEQR